MAAFIRPSPSCDCDGTPNESITSPEGPLWGERTFRAVRKVGREVFSAAGLERRGREPMMAPEIVDSQDSAAAGSSPVGKLSRRTMLRLTAFAAAAAPTLGELVSAPAAHAEGGGGGGGDDNGENA